MVTHGHKRTGKASPTYKIWLGIKRRCTDKKSKDFPKYGAKGIRVSDEWSKSFVKFLADMGERPSLEHTIDRINPAGNYEASNCRWATKFEQGSEHKRNLRSVTVDGIKSKHDDALDTVSMLALMPVWLPSSDTGLKQGKDGIWGSLHNESSFESSDSYFC